MSRPTLARVFLLSAAALSAALADAATYYSRAQNLSIYASASWSTTSGGSSTGLSKFDAAGTYMINYQYLHDNGASAGEEKTFPGNKMVIARGSTGFLPKVDGAILKFGGDGLVIQSNATLRCHGASASGTTLTFRGKLTVEDGSSARPAMIKTTKLAGYGCNYVVESDLYGSSTAYLELSAYSPNSDSTKNYVGWSKLVVAGDASNFKGCIKLMGYTNAVEFANTTFGGGSTSVKVYMESPSRMILPSSGTLTSNIQRGTASGRTTLEFRASSSGYGRLKCAHSTWNGGNASNPLVLVVPTDIAFRGVPTYTNTTEGCVGFTLIENTAAFTVANYALETTPSDYGFSLVNPRLETRQIGSTYHLLLVTEGPLLNYQLSTDSSGSGNHGSSLKSANANNWSQGVVMDADMLNVVPQTMQLMTWGETPMFSGLGLMFEPGAALALSTSEGLSVDRMFMKEASELRLYATSTLSGTSANSRMYLDNWTIFKGAAMTDIVFTNDLPVVCADETVALRFSHAMTTTVSNYVYEVVLNKSNPDFLGKVYVTSGTAANNGRGRMTVAFKDPLAFGGPRTTGADDALTVEKDMRIRALETMTFNDGTRGFKNVGARIAVDEGKTLTFKQAIRWAGVLKKEGLGTFALGGGVRQLTLVNNYSHDLEVHEGAIKPLVTNSFDGVHMVFKGGKLLIPVTTVEPFASYGMVSKKLAEPFSAEGGAAIPLAFDMPSGGLAGDEQTVAVCTVSTAATAEALANGGFRPQAMAGYSVRLSSAQTDAGYTVSARIIRRGSMVFLR